MKDRVTKHVRTEVPWKGIQDCQKQNQFCKTHSKYFTNLPYANIANRDLSINKSHITLIPFRENRMKYLNQENKIIWQPGTNEHWTAKQNGPMLTLTILVHSLSTWFESSLSLCPLCYWCPQSSFLVSLLPSPVNSSWHRSFPFSFCPLC